MLTLIQLEGGDSYVAPARTNSVVLALVDPESMKRYEIVQIVITTLKFRYCCL